MSDAIARLQATGRHWVLDVAPSMVTVNNYSDECIPLAGWTWDDASITTWATTIDDAVAAALAEMPQHPTKTEPMTH